MIKRILIGISAAAVVVYLGFIVALYVLQRDFQYDRTGRMFDLSETALTADTTLVSIPSADGSVLAAWYQPPEEGRPVILYFRGNAQSFSREHPRYERWTEDGYGFLAFDYRGFPGSPGEVTEANILADGLAAYDWLKEKGFGIVIWGRSLGSGPATWVAREREADALFLETPFDSAVAVAADRYGFVPVGLLMHDQFRVDEWIKGVTEPVFVAHGTADTTVLTYHGQRVYDLAPNPRGIWIEEGAGHADLWDRGLWDKARVFFEETSGAVAAAAPG
jgi:fermentation-respiration switch protein FrsA (DUF1100 family)